MTPPRTIPPMEAGERATLTAFLDWQRATLALKMIEEYARHNGHADLLRERLDGSTGELDPERPRFPAPAPLTTAVADLTRSRRARLLPSGACGSPISATST